MGIIEALVPCSLTHYLTLRCGLRLPRRQGHGRNHDNSRDVQKDFLLQEFEDKNCESLSWKVQTSHVSDIIQWLDHLEIDELWLHPSTWQNWYYIYNLTPTRIRQLSQFSRRALQRPDEAAAGRGWWMDQVSRDSTWAICSPSSVYR